MKKKSENSSVSFDPVVVGENVDITFTRVTNANGTTVYGKITKNGANVGNVAYDSSGGYMNTSLKPFDALTKEEVAAIYSTVPECINEALSIE